MFVWKTKNYQNFIFWTILPFNWIPIFVFLSNPLIAFNQIVLHLVYLLLLLSFSPPLPILPSYPRSRARVSWPSFHTEQGEWKSTNQRFQHPMWTNSSAVTGPASRSERNESSPRLPTRAEGDRRSFAGTVPPDHVIRLIASGFAWCFQYYLYGHASQIEACIWWCLGRLTLDDWRNDSLVS